MEGGFLLDVVVSKSATVLKLLASKDEPLLVRWDPLLVLDLGFNIVDGIGAFNFQGDGLPGQSLNENLHTTSEAEHQMEGGFFLDVVICQSTTILKLFSSKDQSLLVWWDPLFVLDLGFNIVDGIGTFNFQRDRLPGESLDKDLHPSSKPEHKMECGLLLNVVVG
ncbi:hypothetical protein HanPI659440_Chr15g0584321 [Helianthus annuus]|nr:hypothetical protein HanPI659440_Chr15g0584321 [Helianthus annuus]